MRAAPAADVELTDLGRAGDAPDQQPADNTTANQTHYVDSAHDDIADARPRGAITTLREEVTTVSRNEGAARLRRIPLGGLRPLPNQARRS